MADLHHHRRVAVLINPSTAFGRDLRKGIGRYAQEVGGWEFASQRGGIFHGVSDLQSWKGDGILAAVASNDMAEQLQNHSAKVVNLASRMEGRHLSTVICDNHAVGQLAAQHLLERGFRALAFYGYPKDYTHSEERWQGFHATAMQSGTTAVCHRIIGWSLAEQRTKLIGWLQELPRPVGIFAATDELAKVLADVCWEEKIPVPEQVAILGTDNDESLLAMTNPALSSIDIDAVRIGYEAAGLLASLMEGHSPPPEPIRIPPKSVITRRSTDILAIQDQDVAAALRIIHERRHQSLTVKEIVFKLAVSRRSFERRFENHLGRSPWQEIRRTQIEYVKQLLAENEYPIQTIAKMSAFGDPRRLSNVFRAETGMTPSAYRKRMTGRAS